uniref:5'-nucleotidase n=1 Tax=Romanomermis culicivorax TaxID=13658 RepID=A0A915IFB9_ROMCU
MQDDPKIGLLEKCYLTNQFYTHHDSHCNLALCENKLLRRLAVVEICYEICFRLLPDIDIIVGGHTHTFLYEGTPPDPVDEPEGPYPIVVERNDTSKCLVVQAYANGKYLGLLNVKFDRKGYLKRWTGNPILIDTGFEEDVEILGILDHFAQNITFAEQQIIARTMVPLGNMHDVCRTGECLIGDILTDSLFHYMKRKLRHRHSSNIRPNPTEPIFGLAVLNSGGIRQFSAKAGSNITLSNLYSVLPFSNKITVLRLNGSLLYRMFERSIEKFSMLSRHGKFLQVSSGARIVYDLDCERRDKDNNSFSYHLHNISSLIVPCIFNCRRTGTFTLENEEAKIDGTYLVAMTTFMATGGDGYGFLNDEKLLMNNLGDDLDIDVALEYLEKIKPIRMTVQNRILMNSLDCVEHL